MLGPPIEMTDKTEKTKGLGYSRVLMEVLLQLAQFITFNYPSLKNIEYMQKIWSFVSTFIVFPLDSSLLNRIKAHINESSAESTGHTEVSIAHNDSSLPSFFASNILDILQFTSSKSSSVAPVSAPVSQINQSNSNHAASILFQSLFQAIHVSTEVHLNHLSTRDQGAIPTFGLDNPFQSSLKTIDEVGHRLASLDDCVANDVLEAQTRTTLSCISVSVETLQLFLITRSRSLIRRPQ
jgi:hypothetical protein